MIVLGGQPLADYARRMQPLTGVDDDRSFEQRLAETIVWCSGRVETGLRSRELDPGLAGASALWNDPAAHVAALAKARSRLVGAIEPVQDVAGLAGGRLLVFFPAETLQDGAAEAESDGFFDAANIPAWDTWVAVFDDADEPAVDYIVSWVPPALAGFVNGGINVNPEECIRWLQRARVPLADELLARGLV
jgi:hypothetical protein